jgi:hypothetical protein
MLSKNFDDPYSLSNIAKIIRQSIIQLRNPKDLETGIIILDKLMRNNVKNNKFPHIKFVPDEISVNSNYKYDWCDLVDFGYKDQCRFYRTWTCPSYLRVFRLNPKKYQNQWLSRDRNGAEVSFRIEKIFKDKFINAWKRDMMENFQNIKK